MPKRLIIAEDLLRLHFIGDAQMSPDGTRILFGKKHVDTDKNKYVSNLFTVDMEGHTQQWTSGEGGAGSGRWSKDGSKIAFISGREGKKPQIFTINTSGGEAQKLTGLPEGSIGGIAWSPDSKWIAFTFRETDALWTEGAEKERKEKGLSTPPRIITKDWYRLDDDGYFLDQRFAVYVVNVATGEHKIVFAECVMGDYSFDWSPDSKELVIGHPRGKRPTFEKADIRVVRVTIEDGQVWELKGIPFGTKGTLKWSPNGKQIAFLGNDDDAGWGCLNDRLWVIPSDGGEGRCLTLNDDYCLTTGTMSDTRVMAADAVVEWSPDSKAIYVSVGHHGETQIGFVEVEKGGLQVLAKGKHVTLMGNLSADGEKIACVFGTTLKPVEIAVYDISKHQDEPELLTSYNAELLEELKLSKPEEMWLDSDDGQKVHAWVMLPTEYLAPKRYPVVLEIHGGPHAQYGVGFFHEFQLLAAQGYVVVYSNPRGSKGYGENHCKAIQGKWGDRDWEDIQTVVRWMQHQPYIHPGQMGVMGGSYGGYMTNWVVGHTNDFKAAITDRCVSNLANFGGTSDFITPEDQYWPGVFFGDITALWDQSPIKYFKNVKTPMLIIHSEGDLRCNIEQSEQIYGALCHEQIEARFIRYPVSTFHGLSRTGPPDLRIHRLGEILAWWERHLKVT